MIKCLTVAAYELGFQAQLPWANDPTHTSVYQGYLAAAERFRVALRVTRDFY